MDPASSLPLLLGVAVLLPLGSFFAILIFGPKMGPAGKCAGYLATMAVGMACLLSFIALFGCWIPHHPRGAGEHVGKHAAAAQQETLIVRGQSPANGPSTAADTEHHSKPSASSAGGHEPPAATAPSYYTGEYRIPGTRQPWVLGQFGSLRLSISYYIDALTVCMFCMVTFIATLIHVYSTGYMHEELSEVVDHEVTLPNGHHLHRRGRYHRFFQYLSLFTCSMLGLVLAGNVAMVFVFWELVGICSYFLIGFYVERKSASNAANKAFIVNRVGDFGMIIGMMAFWSSLGTLSFGASKYADRDGVESVHPGIFELVGTQADIVPPDDMVVFAARAEMSQLARQSDRDSSAAITDAVQSLLPSWRAGQGRVSWGGGYWLWVLGGVGIFAGCVGKSAQFPLHVWLPDAMEGPTPVSALVHSATMVAAGVYLVGRFYPAFAPEVLLVIAVVGCITLFLAATIAITATDIKRVLAYSTVSQLGYMMMALGVGAWLAGMLHLITHAFFKSLLFMCSGSVIHAVHTNEMPQMGGLLKKMPVTAVTMLIGCLAIAGAGVPFVIGALGGPELAGLGLSGFYSKDAILEQAFSFLQVNTSPLAGLFFLAGAAGAAITAFYMFRLWYLTFLGKPRDAHRYEHAHESPAAMYVPLVILAVMAVAVAWSPMQGVIGSLAAGALFLVGRGIWGTQRNEQRVANGFLAVADLPFVLSVLVLLISLSWWGAPVSDVTLSSLLTQAEPVRAASGMRGVLLNWNWPSEHLSHAPGIVVPVTLIALGASFAGFLFATLMYALERLSAEDVRRQFARVYDFLRNKWWFDELYDAAFVRPAHTIAGLAAGCDRRWIDWFVDGLATVTRKFSVVWDRVVDQSFIDGLANQLARWTYAGGSRLRAVQTGRIRQYVMFIVVAAVALFILISFWNSTLAG
jgi:NADH-quinone oxidoreductase subunit L